MEKDGGNTYTEKDGVNIFMEKYGGNTYMERNLGIYGAGYTYGEG